MTSRARNWLRASLARPVSLRTKITAAFTLVVVGGTAISTLIGSRIITNALMNDAQARAVRGLDTARMVYTEALQATADAVARAAAASVARQGGVDSVLDHQGAPVDTDHDQLQFFAAFPAGPLPVSDPCLASESMRALVRGALEGRRRAAAEVLAATCLKALKVESARARTRLLDEPPTEAPDIASGLALIAAAPIAAHDGRVLGAAYGGVLLNERPDIVDRVRLLVSGNDVYEGRPLGTASIFLGDVRVATNVTTASGARAIGTRASSAVSEAVLHQGVRWRGRALVLHDWYIAAYDPIRNHSGQVIGMLYVGMLEAPILAVRTSVMFTFLVVCGFGLLVVFALTYFITRRTISPLEEIVAATRKVVTGDLSVRVPVASTDEIGDLARAFNDMVSSLETSKRELEEWGRTLEERVRERTDQLVAVQAQMARSEKLASIGRLAAGVAHSLNNPLGGILSLSMLAQEGCADPALGGDLDTIAKQALRCREIVKGLLEFSRQTEARAMRTAVNAIVDGAVQLLQRQAVFHNIGIERRFQPDVPDVMVDSGQLQEVITNLLVNAVDAMETGGRLTIETASAASTGEGPSRVEVVIRVADTGKGIPADVMPLLFEPFFTTKAVGKGTGLGLAIAHGVVTQAGGRIEVDSSPAGTVFTIHLPAAAAEAEVITTG